MMVLYPTTHMYEVLGFFFLPYPVFEPVRCDEIQWDTADTADTAGYSWMQWEWD